MQLVWFNKSFERFGLLSLVQWAAVACVSSAVYGGCNSEFPAEFCIADGWQLLTSTDQLSTDEDAFQCCIVGLMYRVSVVMIYVVDVWCLGLVAVMCCTSSSSVTCCVTAEAEESTWCYYQVCSVFFICTVLPSIVLCTIMLICVVVSLISPPRMGESGCASCERVLSLAVSSAAAELLRRHGCHATGKGIVKPRFRVVVK